MKFLKFGAPWCGSCKTLSATIKNAWDSDIVELLEDINVDDNMVMSQQYKIKSMPTVVVLDDANNEVARFTGTAITPANLREYM